jgi:hypothetical protein
MLNLAVRTVTTVLYNGEKAVYLSTATYKHPVRTAQ